jgi:hypothetical protein
MKHELRNMTDGERVIHIANVQEISELEVFHRAHQHWFGEAPQAEQLEQEFVRYLYFGATPHWVRHYCRDVHARSAQPLPGGPANPGILNAIARLTDSRLARFLVQ